MNFDIFKKKEKPLDRIPTPTIDSQKLDQENLNALLSKSERELKIQEECIVEAKKLKYNLESLTKEIDKDAEAFGGLDQLKEYFEKAIETSGKNEDGSDNVVLNKAGLEQRKLDSIMDEHKITFSHAKFVAITLGIAVLLNMAGKNGFSVENNAVMDYLSSGPEIGPGKMLQAIIVLLHAVAAGGGIGAYFEKRYEAGKARLQKEIDALKFKIIGVNIIDKKST